MESNAAARLLDARQTGKVLTRESLACISDTAAAYRVQKDQIVLSGEGIGGWKLGGTSAPALELLGLDEPFYGAVAADSIAQNNSTIPVFASHTPMIETEFAVVLGADLLDRSTSYSRHDVLPHVESVHASFEIVAARMDGGFAGAGHLVIADHSVNVAVILGERIPRQFWSAPEEIDVTLSINGSETMRGTSAGLLWDHIFDGVAWLANRQQASVRPIRKGDVVMTGTCTGVTGIIPGDVAEASFGNVAKVAAKFTGR